MSPRRSRGDDRARKPEPTELAGRGAESAEASGDNDLLDLIDHLGTLLERSDLAELEVQSGATSIVLRRAEPASSPGSGTAPAVTPSAEPGSSALADGASPASGPRVQAVVAPLTGIFYAAPTPEAPPFVNVGVDVVVGQVIGLIEAMKLFNEIKSDIAGRVQRVVAESGQLVKARDPLIEVAPRA
jgi:acetyl-CoA carboxylase biotin carboxyl carrier protein